MRSTLEKESMALTSAEQKQIRDALCAIAVRGARHPGEYDTARDELTKQFEALKAAAVQPVAKEK
jgi:hypothetical protein